MNRRLVGPLDIMSKALQYNFVGREITNAVGQKKSKQTRCSLRNGSEKTWTPMSRSQALTREQRRVVAEELVVMGKGTIDSRVDALEKVRRIQVRDYGHKL